MNAPMSFFDSYSIIECAAREFSSWRTSKHPDESDRFIRTELRRDAVRVLRYMWSTGDACQRQTVVCRVALWMNHPDVYKLSKAVAAREKARLCG